MDILSVAILIFIVLETMNILMLYFVPGTKKGNGIGVFNAYEKSKNDPEVHSLVSYLINWVAGTKLIFVFLLVVVLLEGSEKTRLFAVIALILSILSFYWRLYPAISKMDKRNEISPAGYSRTLFSMITVFIAGFAIALVVHLL